MTVIKRGLNTENKKNVYLINPGNIEQIWVGNSYNPEALKAHNAKYVGEIECTSCLRNLLDGRMTPLTIEEIETEINEIKKYSKSAKAIIETEGYYRAHGEDATIEYNEELKIIKDAEKYASEFEELLSKITSTKQKTYQPIRMWVGST